MEQSNLQSREMLRDLFKLCSNRLIVKSEKEMINDIKQYDSNTNLRFNWLREMLA